jgi:hypothetical protein
MQDKTSCVSHALRTCGGNLLFPQALVGIAVLDEFFMHALLHDLTVLHINDQVGRNWIKAEAR